MLRGAVNNALDSDEFNFADFHLVEEYTTEDHSHNDDFENVVFDIDEYKDNIPLSAELIKIFLSGEYIAHTFAYKYYLPVNKNFLLQGEDKKKYSVRLIEVNHFGLIPILITPHFPSNNIHLTFRGTKGDASFGRDGHAAGAGYVEFEKDADLIVDEIFNLARDATNPISINLSGHSLGGADAQNCMSKLLARLADDECEATVQQNINCIRLIACQSAGIPSDSAIRADEAVEKLKNLCCLPKLECFWVVSDGDAIQQQGETSIFVNSDFANVRVYLKKFYKDRRKKNYIKKVFSALDSHKVKSHNIEDSQLSKYEYYSNGIDEHREIITKKLTHKSSFINYGQQGLTIVGVGEMLNKATKDKKPSDRFPDDDECVRALCELARFEEAAVSNYYIEDSECKNEDSHKQIFIEYRCRKKDELITKQKFNLVKLQIEKLNEIIGPVIEQKDENIDPKDIEVDFENSIVETASRSIFSSSHSQQVAGGIMLALGILAIVTGILAIVGTLGFGSVAGVGLCVGGGLLACGTVATLFNSSKKSSSASNVLLFDNSLSSSIQI